MLSQSHMCAHNIFSPPHRAVHELPREGHQAEADPALSLEVLALNVWLVPNIQTLNGHKRY